MKNVYVFLETWSVDYETGANVRVYANVNDAVDAMKKTFEYWKSQYPEWIEEFSNDTVLEPSCSIWEDGDYTRNHMDFQVTHLEIM